MIYFHEKSMVSKPNHIPGFIPLRWFPLVFGTIAGLLSLPETVNKILFGGTGKNGSTVAVSNLALL